MTIKKSPVALQAQMDNCFSKITADMEKEFELNKDKIAQGKADLKFLTWSIQAKAGYNSYAKSWTSFADKLILGADSTDPAILPTLPTLPAMPAIVPAGIRERFIDLANDIAGHKKCTPAILVNLGLEPASTISKSGPSAPVATVKLEAGHPIISFIKNKFTGAQIYKDSGDGNGFVKLDKSNLSKFKDESLLPPSGTAVLWRYRLIYLKGNTEVGDFSNTIEITVTGL